jgi:KDO2-lipid IV(A) lauroyltransferase
MSVPLRKRVRRGARSLLLRALIRLLSRAPLGLAFALGDLVGRLAWPLARRTRREMLAQLAIAFPEKTPAEREAVARASLVHLGRLAGEVVSARSFAPRIRSYVGFAGDGEELMREVLSRGKGLLYVTGHVGNWELMAQRVGDQFPAVTIAKAGPDPRMNELIEEFRASGGMGTLWREDPRTSRAMIRAFRDGKVFGLLIDQDTKVQGVFVPFFGRPAFTPRAAGDLALRFRAPVVVGWCRRRGPGAGAGHEIHLREVPYQADPADREAESVRITAACTAVLEEAIRGQPEEWVWMHQRWKTQPPSGPPAEGEASSVPKSRELSAG